MLQKNFLAIVLAALNRLHKIFSERWSSLGYFSSCIYGVVEAICTNRPNAPREVNIAMRFVHSCSPTPSSDGHGFRPRLATHMA